MTLSVCGSEVAAKVLIVQDGTISISIVHFSGRALVLPAVAVGQVLEACAFR